MPFQFSPQEEAARMERLSKILRKRKDRGQTYQQAAAASGYSVSTLKRWAKLLGLDGK